MNHADIAATRVFETGGQVEEEKPEAPECSLTNCKEERVVMRKVVDRLREK